MIILRIGDRVKLNFSSGEGEIVGHGTINEPDGGSTVLTYAVRLDKQFQGLIDMEGEGPGCYISTILVCADGVTKI